MSQSTSFFYKSNNPPNHPATPETQNNQNLRTREQNTELDDVEFSRLYQTVSRPLPAHLETKQHCSNRGDTNDCFVVEAEFWNYYRSLEKDFNSLSFSSLSVEIDDLENRASPIEQDLFYEAHLKEIDQLKSTCQFFAEQIKHSLEQVSQVEEGYCTLIKKTTALYLLCKKSLEEQQTLREFVSQLSHHLSYFETLEYVARKFNNPDINVEDERFIILFNQLDEATNFFIDNQDILDADKYLAEANRLKTRGMILIQNHIVKAFEDVLPLYEIYFQPPLSALSQSKILTEELEKILHSLFLENTKLGSMVTTLKPLCLQIERRSKQTERTNFLLDVHREFFRIRRATIQDKVREHLSLIAQSEEIIKMVKSGFFYLMHLCTQEHVLYSKFFSGPSSGLKALIEEVSATLCDRILHSLHQIRDLQVLFDLTNTLKYQFNEYISKKPVELEALKPTLDRILKDTQSRLIFIACTYLKDKISRFDPTPEDLDYPNLLLQVCNLKKNQHFNSFAEQNYAQNKEVDSAAFTTTWDANIEDWWYPTLRYTLQFLNKLYISVDTQSFDELAQEAVVLCIKTLCVASGLLGQRQSKLDADLFIIKYLEILQEQILPLNVNFLVLEKNLDFSHVRESFRKLLHGEIRLSSFFVLSKNNALVSILQHATPKINYSEKDLRENMEHLLFQTIESFILTSKNLLVGDLISFVNSTMEQINCENSGKQEAEPLSSSKSFALSEVDHLIKGFRANFKPKLLFLTSRLNLYLGDHPNKFVLLSSVKTEVLRSIDRFNSVVQDYYPDRQHSAIQLKSELCTCIHNAFYFDSSEDFLE